ncbi:hypothetical protein Daesc_007407 [Daldinia eschscholtzii]|uniref:Uncharacterized protein n=1 Tax=Daldinia eschscholtzii TaxID=292717 RepID=A0AAX6ME04_9PEZI
MLSASRTPITAPARSCFYHTRSSHQKRISGSTLLSVQLQRTGIYPSKAALIRSLQQSRHQSSSNEPNRQTPPLPTPKLLIRALRQSLSFRPLVSAFRGQSLRSLYRQSPEELVIAIILYFQSRQFTRFPPQIAKSLRRALYYSNYSPDPPLALKYYKLALEQCSQAGLDPFSDEVMGIKIQLAAWFEKIGSYKNSIDVLESLVRDCKRWLEVLEKSVRDGLVDSSGRLAGSPSPQPPTTQEDTEKEPATKPENLWGKRTRILGKLVGISVKLGELYSDEHVLQGDSAGQHLVWAVETVLKELQRRQVEGVKEGEGDWMTPEQIGGALEAQQPVHTPTDSNQTTQGSASNVTNRPTRSTLLASARAWALQAQETARKVQGEDRTDECDEACAVALCNLGDIAAMAGDAEEARRKFKESLSLSKRIAFDPGVAQAEDGLRRLS